MLAGTTGTGWAFDNNPYLKTLEFNKEVKRMETSIKNCSKLKKVKFNGKKAPYLGVAETPPFEGCDKKLTVYYPKGAKGFNTEEWKKFKRKTF